MIASKLQEAIQAKLSLFQEAAEDQESDNRILFEVDDTVKKFIISSSMAGRPAMTFSENYNLSNDFGRQQRAAESRDDPNDKPGRRCPCFGV